MKRTKTNKGITLIALIITIVVLLILAGVAISSIQENGILSYAQNAADSWNKAQVNEQAQLDKYLEYLNQQLCSNHIWELGSEYTDEVSVCSNCGIICSHENLEETKLSHGGTNEFQCYDLEKQCKVCGQMIYGRRDGP